ncbi:hypothetical protein H2199_000813 [Coniosporium tulheliwenetii]|uniref:Uncharacterized protein n=1 Tax=Coniosporium tulheliwenetii TaxID=3383036 RepID=A0ACC2ZMS8_9PEZI|nr:hypothetical protein H2199_000813 [Cladosporium sp. JES 115]
MVLAHLAGIKVFATGGLGGVHRGAESSMDISADLTELGRTPVAVISSGCKSFLDIPRTLEYLETEGVGVVTFADGREGNVDFPAFWSRDSGLRSPMTIRNEQEAAAIIHAHHALSLSSGLLLANPIPADASVARSEIDGIIEDAIQEATSAGASGKDNTPFILAKIKELTGGKSVIANRALIEANVRRGTSVAKELLKLERMEQAVPVGTRSDTFTVPAWPSTLQSTVAPSLPEATSNAADVAASAGLDKSTAPPKADIVVAGALAIDFSCDYAPLPGAIDQVAPQLHTSNPSIITQTLGGVAHNIAKAAHYMGASVRLCSAVGDDLSGRAAVAQLSSDGLQTSSIKVLDASTGQRTAQYVAVNDAHKDLTLAMADMSIIEQPDTWTSDRLSHLQAASPQWAIVDANWDPANLHAWLMAAKSVGAQTAFEPVSTAKSIRLFQGHSPTSAPTSSKSRPTSTIPTFPNHIVDLMTPNNHELHALHTSARSLGLFDSPAWWATIDSLGLPSSGSRTALSHLTSPALVDEGIPQMSIQLLPFVPCILTKLGPKGVLLTQLLPAGDERLSGPGDAPYVLGRDRTGSETVGGCI